MERKPMFDRERMQVLDKWLSGSGTEAATTAFKEFVQAATDFATTVMAFNVAKEEAADMISATKERIQMERNLAVSRAAELEKTANDPDRSETVRRVAVAELAKIKQQKIAATPEEQEAIADLIEQQTTAQHDLRKLQNTTQAALEALNMCIEEIRAAVIGYDTDHKEVFVAGYKKELAKLCEEVPVYE